jgi:hypothetical protein
MRTTVRLEEGLLEQAKREAERRGMTLTALIEHGLRLAMRRPRSIGSGTRVKLPVSRARGGVIAGVDLNDSAALLERMDGIG